MRRPTNGSSSAARRPRRGSDKARPRVHVPAPSFNPARKRRRCGHAPPGFGALVGGDMIGRDRTAGQVAWLWPAAPSGRGSGLPDGATASRPGYAPSAPQSSGQLRQKPRVKYPGSARSWRRIQASKRIHQAIGALDRILEAGGDRGQRITEDRLETAVQILRQPLSRRQGRLQRRQRLAKLAVVHQRVDPASVGFSMPADLLEGQGAQGPSARRRRYHVIGAAAGRRRHDESTIASRKLRRRRIGQQDQRQLLLTGDQAGRLQLNAQAALHQALEACTEVLARRQVQSADTAGLRRRTAPARPRGRWWRRIPTGRCRPRRSSTHAS